MFVAIVGGNGGERKQKAKEMLPRLFPKTSFQFALFEKLPSEDELLSFAHQSQSFFGDRPIVLLKDIGEELIDTYSKQVLEELSLSESGFFLLDESLTKAVRTKIEKHNGQVVEIASSKKKAAFDPGNIFAICDAFSGKKKFAVWHEFSKLTKNNESPEAIVGILFSRVRTMLRDKRYGSYTKEELRTLSGSLALLLPRERAKGSDTLFALERWILTLPE